MACFTRRAFAVAAFGILWLGSRVAVFAQVPIAKPVPDTVTVAPTAVVDTAAEPVVLDIRLGKVGASTVQAFRVGNEALLPLSAFMELAEIKHQPVTNGRLAATLQPGDKAFVADAKGGFVSLGATRVTPPPRELTTSADEVFLSTAVIAKLLNVAFRIDWAELSANIDDPSTLPLAARLSRGGERAARLRISAEAQTRIVADATLGLSRPLLDGAVLDYSLSVPSGQPLKDASYAVQLGADLLGGSLQSDVSGTQGLLGLALRNVTTWTGVWRDSPLLKQARLGSTLTTGLGPQAITGATITNAPYVRSASFGTLEFPGRVGPRWEVEVYRDGLLLAVDSTDAQGRFRVPLEVRYGTNVVKFIAYGPNGEVTDFTGSFLLADNLIPKNHFEYAASAGHCAGSSCQAAANLDLRYGIAKTWTIRAGVDGYDRSVTVRGDDTLTQVALDSAKRIRDTSSVLPALPVVPAMAARLSRGYASISGNPLHALNVTAGVIQHTSTNLAFQYEPTSYLNVVASRTAYPSPLSDPLLGVVGVLSEERISGFFRPFGERRSLFIDGSEVLRHTVAETQNTMRASTSFEYRFVRFSPFILRDTHHGEGSSEATNGFGLGAFIPPTPQLGAFLGRFSLRPSIESRTGSGIDQVSLGFARTFGDTRLDGSFSQGRAGGRTLSMTISTDLSRMRIGTSVNASPGSNSASEFVQGSMIFDPATRKRIFYRGPALGRSGVKGKVFLDANGDGVMNADEEALAGVFVKVGTTGTQTDSLGQFSVWDIPPFEPVTVQLDTTTFTNPIWTPLQATISIQPGPHRFEPVNFAVVVGGSVEGRVVREVQGGVAVPVPGATIVFTDTRTHTDRSVDTFSDGTFAVSGVRPGNYVVSLDSGTLTALKGRADTVPITVKSSKDGSSVKDVVLTVHIDSAQPGS
jgi:hypothetical protein